MTDLEFMQWLRRMSRFLDHRDGCTLNTPDFAFDHRNPEACVCGLQKFRRAIRTKIQEL